MLVIDSRLSLRCGACTCSNETIEIEGKKKRKKCAKLGRIPLWGWYPPYPDRGLGNYSAKPEDRTKTGLKKEARTWGAMMALKVSRIFKVLILPRRDGIFWLVILPIKP